MIDTVIDSVSNTSNVKDKNKELGNRVKRHTLITKYFDNMLRIDHKLIRKDILTFSILLCIIVTFYYNKNMLNISYNENIILIKDSLYYIGVYIVESLANSKLISMVNDWLILFEINYKIEELDILKDIEVKQLSYNLLYYYMGVIVLVLMYFISIYYQFYTQKQLFNSGIVNMYIPKIFLYHFYKRKKNKYVYMRLIRHQQNKTIYSSGYELVIRNVFFENDINIDKKIDLIIEPKRFLFIYDYFKVYYTIEDKKPTKKANNDIDTIKQKINNNKNEILEKINENEVNELQLLDKELLDNLEI